MGPKRRIQEELKKLRALRRQDEAKALAAWAELQGWLEKRIGTTPRARLKWLLEVFLYADLKGASDQMWAEWLPLLNGFAARGTLRWLVSPRPGKEIIITRYDRKAFRALPDSIRYELKRGWIDSVRLHKGHPTATEDERLEIIRCQGALRDLFEGLARGRLCTPDLGNLKLICRIGPAQPGKPGPHLLVRHYYGPLFAKLLLAALDQLEAVGPNRLRVCPFQEPGRRITIAGREGCGRVFIAAKGQIYCSRLHSAKASYLRWKNRGFPRRHRQKKTFPNTIG